MENITSNVKVFFQNTNAYKTVIEPLKKWVGFKFYNSICFRLVHNCWYIVHVFYDWTQRNLYYCDAFIRFMCVKIHSDDRDEVG